jgi:hypothetical protein
MSEPIKPAVQSGWIALQVVMMPRDANPMPTSLPGMTQNTTFATSWAWCSETSQRQRVHAKPFVDRRDQILRAVERLADQFVR